MSDPGISNNKINIHKFWIEDLITKQYPNFEKDKQADLNGNGKIEKNEILTDTNNNKIIGDNDDYVEYFSKNRNLLAQQIPFFKWGQNFSARNRLHEIIYTVSDLYPQEAVKATFDKVAALQERLPKQKNPSIKEEVISYYKAIQGAGIKYVTSTEHLVSDLMAGNLDCNTSGYVAIALGDERGVHLDAVHLTTHAFVRGIDEKGVPFNMDQGYIFEDSDYVSDFNLNLIRLEHSNYLKTLSPEQFRAELWAERAETLYHKKWSNLNNAIQNNSNPTHNEKEENEILEIIDAAFRLDPKSIDIRRMLIRSLLVQERNTEALRLANKTLELDPQNPDIYTDRVSIFKQMKRTLDELQSLKKAIQYKILDEKAHHLIEGTVQIDLAKENETEKKVDFFIQELIDSDVDFKQADDYRNKGELDKYYYTLGLIHLRSSNLEKAWAAFGELIKLQPKNSIGPCYATLGNLFYDYNYNEEALLFYLFAHATAVTNELKIELQRSIQLLTTRMLQEKY